MRATSLIEAGPVRGQDSESIRVQRFTPTKNESVHSTWTKPGGQSPCFLAALWATATHAPLLAEAFRGEVSADVAVIHSLPALVATLIAFVWMRTALSTSRLKVGAR